MSSARYFRPVCDPGHLHGDPADVYTTTRSWIGFRTEHLFGVLLWGELSGADLQQLTPFLPPRTGRALPCLIDLRHVRSVDAGFLDVRQRMLTDHHDLSISVLSRNAVVTAAGPMAAVARGLRSLHPPPFPEQFFEHPADALRWLGCEHEIPIYREVERLHAEALQWPLIARLRELLDRRGRVTLPDAARELGVSTRSLQRTLAGIGSNYQRERNLATVRVAQRMLIDPGASVTEIAFAVGCSSSQ